MINLRYHIVSITAVFLALGIGLTLGSSFLDRVTVDNLKHRLDSVQTRVDATEAENGALSGQVDALRKRDGGLADELPERLMAGHLDGVPVLVIAARGTDEALVTAAIRSLSAAGAQVAGTWWLTDGWLLEDAKQASTLAGVLGVNSTDPDRLRRNGAIQMAELLNQASKPPVPQLDPATGAPVIPSADPRVVPSPASEPELLAKLRDAGFIDYQALVGSGDERALLPGASARYVVVSGASPGAGPQRFAASLLDAVVANGVAPVVAAQGLVDLPKADAPPSEDDRRTTFVGPLRAGDLTRDRLSTIDDLDTAAGLAALVLAVEDLGTPLVGHYGAASSATRLLPAVPTG
ncbi:MAG: copper transporter [Acidimicrobiales bacterium]